MNVVFFYIFTIVLINLENYPTMKKEMKKHPKSIRPFDDNNFAQLSNKIFEKTYRTQLGPHAQKLLYGLSCSLTGVKELFPVWQIHISELFKYLNISENNNDKYDIVREAFEQIQNNPLQYRINAKRWGGYPWLNRYDYDEEKSRMVNVEFNENVREYLLKVKEYCLLEVKFYIQLTSKYAMWFYPRFRSVANQENASVTYTLQEIIDLTFNEKTKAYKPSEKEIKSFNVLNRIIGIQKKRGEDIWRCATKKSKDKKGNPVEIETGMIAEINANTDIHVTCEVQKKGKTYDSITFFVHLKKDTYQGKRKSLRKTYRTQFKDFQKKKEAIEDIKHNQMKIPLQSVEEVAKAKDISVSQAIRELGYCLTVDGKSVTPLN